MKNRKTTKAALITAMQTLLQKNAIETQEEICVELLKEGYHVNQVMVSRLLHKMGVIRITEGDKSVYRLATEFAAVNPEDSLKHLVLNIKHNESLIIIQTTPGSAQLVARLLDQKKLSGILGTVAGDDTIFVAPEKIRNIKVVFSNIYELLSGSR